MNNIEDEINIIKDEIKILKLDLDELKKIHSLIPPKTVVEKKDIMENFFKMNLSYSKGERVNTSLVFKKINEFSKKYDAILTKFEVSNFIKEKGYKRTKISSNNYYLDLKLLDDTFSK